MAADETDTALEQVQGNKKTHSGFMTTVLGDDWIANDQTGVFPRTSNRGNKYICVFYIFDPNFIKGVPIKSRHKEELLRAYQVVYKWCEARGVKPQYIKWTTRHQRMWKSLPWNNNKQSCNTQPRTRISAQWRKLCKRTKPHSNLYWLPYQNNFKLHIGANF